MCGQMGFMTNGICHNADDFLSDAFMANMVRGVDSSGIVNIDVDREEYILHKLPVSGAHFTTDTVAKRLMKYATGKQQITLAHVRAATVGNVSLSNAHPFAIEMSDFTLVGTHNGTLTGWQNQEAGKHYDVDSEWALSRIAVHGIDAFKKFTGAYSFVWWKGDDPSHLYMARNKDRPMAVAFLPNGAMAYASEAGMLFWLLERNHIYPKGKILILDEDKMYKFKVGEPENFTTEDLPKASVTYNYRGSSNYSNRTYKTTVQAVEELLKSAGVNVEDTSKETSNTLPQAYPQEMKLAREYGWYDTEAEFVPMTTNSAGNTEGIAEVMGNEFDAIVRGNFAGIHSMNTIWKCRVLGVQDDGKNLVMVLSTPSRELVGLEEM